MSLFETYMFEKLRVLKHYVQFFMSSFLTKVDRRQNLASKEKLELK